MKEETAPSAPPAVARPGPWIRGIVLDEQGPDHNKCFKVAAEVRADRFPAAWGNTKKDAELKAAMNALAYIHGDPLPFPCD